MENFITTKEAATILDIRIETVSRLIHRGILKGERFGPVWMVDKDSVNQYFTNSANKSKNDPTRKKLPT